MQGLESGVNGETEAQGGSPSAMGLPDLWPCLLNSPLAPTRPLQASPSLLWLRDPPFCLLGDPLTPLPPSGSRVRAFGGERRLIGRLTTTDLMATVAKEMARGSKGGQGARRD